MVIIDYFYLDLIRYLLDLHKRDTTLFVSCIVLYKKAKLDIQMQFYFRTFILSRDIRNDVIILNTADTLASVFNYTGWSSNLQN